MKVLKYYEQNIPQVSKVKVLSIPVVSNLRVGASLKGHRGNLMGCEMINGRRKEKKVLIHIYFNFYDFFCNFK